MSAISLTWLYERLSIKFGKETAENITSYIETKINDDLENKVQTLATKEDLSKVELKISDLEIRLSNKISDSKSDILRWIISMWITLILMMLGIFLKG
jgi:hypothetical protein